MADFNPYHKWLGIPLKDQPPNHYRLLGIELFESDPDVIESAADQRMAHVRTFQTGQNSALSQRILNEISAAKICLLNSQKRAEYDRQLREKIPLPPGPRAGAPGRGEGVRPLPKATPLPTDQPAPAVVSSSPPTSGIRKRPKKPPVWQQPAVMAGAAAAVVLVALGGYYLTAGKQPSTVAVNRNPNTAPPAPSTPNKTNSPAPDKSSTGKSTTDKSSPAPAAPPAVAATADFEILAATWGADDKSVDVTEGVRGQVKDHRLMMTVWPNMFGSPEDPAKGVAKKLRIRYRSRGHEYKAEYFDSWFVYLDGSPPLPPTDSPGALEIVEARYGAVGTFLDVLPEVRKHVADGRLSMAADEFAATTAAELEEHGLGTNAFKVLWVRYRDHTGEHFDYAWNSQLLTIDTRLPPAAGRPVDLLRLIDLPRDVVYGDWSMQDGQLLAPAQMAARIQMPYPVPSDYALNVVVESDGQLAEVGAGLVVGGHQVLATIDSGDELWFSGMALVKGLWHGDYKNPTITWQRARMLEQGHPNTLTYIVRPTSVRVLRDGAEIVRWSGDPATLSVPDNWKVPDPRKLYLQSHNFPYRVTKVELTPLVPETSPMLTIGESGLSVDVLESINLQRDRLHGDWQYDGQTLVSPADDIRARVRLPAIVPDNYQLDLLAQRESGNALILTVPIAGTVGTLFLDAYEGKISGLQKIDDQLIDKNETRFDGSIFADGKRHLLRLTVQTNHVRLLCDGKPIVDWTGDVSRLKSTESLPYHDRIYVGTWQSRYRFTRIELTPLDSEAVSEPPPDLAGPAIDALKRIDPERDAVAGEWRMENGALVSPKQSAARLEVPFAPSGGYELTTVAERLSGTDSFVIGLVIGGRQVATILDGYGGETAGLADLDRHDGAENETTRRGRLLPPGKPHTIICTVRGNGLRVTCDGTEVIRWSGDAARLSNSVFWEVPDKRRLFLGAWESEFKYTRVEVRPLPAAKDEGGTRKLSDLAGDMSGGKASRLPVPDEDDQRKARQELIKKIASAKTPEQKRKLALDFIGQSAAASEAHAAAYARLEQAIELAKDVGDLDLAGQAIDQLAQSFDVDADDLRQKSLTEIGKTAKSPERYRELIDAASRLMASALAAGKIETVKRAAAQAQSWAKRTKDKTLQKEVAGRAAGATKLAAEIGAVNDARKVLKATPDDPHANFVVGHFELCAADDWEPALVKLAKGDDAGWKKLAAGSRPLLDDLSDPEAQVATADAWWDEAEKEPWPGRHYLRLRAANWYQLALPSLTDAKRTHAEQRLKLLLASDEGLPAWEVFDGGQTVRGFRRMTRGGGMRTRVDYDGPIDVTFTARTDSLEIRLRAYDRDVVIWNWSDKPNELRVTRPDGSIVPFPVKPLEPNRWYEFHYRITPRGTNITVDGVPVFSENQAYGIFSRAAVGVTGWGNAVVDVKKFVVKMAE